MNFKSEYDFKDLTFIKLKFSFFKISLKLFSSLFDIK